ncbi:MAG: MFS transporter [Acidobacteriota bacterium]
MPPLTFGASLEHSQQGAERALLFVSIAVLLASSTWFSGTAAAPQLRALWRLSDAESAWLTISVQLGFITGTFLYAALNISDRFNARKVFFASALAGALFNVAFAWIAPHLIAAIVFRFLTGLMLAGVYPVGMKIVASWFQTGLGWRLGVMVGALTVGTASPYLILALGAPDYKMMATAASVSAAAGGLLILVAVGDGPHLKGRARFDPAMIVKVFRHPPFRYTALGYFGHMWELYAFWSLSSFYLAAKFKDQTALSISVISFLAIGVGVVGCIAGGWISRTAGERRVAMVSMIISATCCLASGFAYQLSTPLLVVFILVWGIFVISDSPQFSALAARHCPPDYTGTALTTQNGIGFAVTVFSIQLLPLIAGLIEWRWAFTFLAFGPAAGAYFMSRLERD